MKLWDFIMLKLKTSFETLKAEYEAHEANENAHNVDRFIKKDVTNDLSSNDTVLKHGVTNPSGYSIFLNFIREKQTVGGDLIRNRNIYLKTKDINRTFSSANVIHYAHRSCHEGSNAENVIGMIANYKETGSEKSYYRFSVRSNTELNDVLELHYNQINFMNRILKNPYNVAGTALSGTPRVVTILLDSTPYYFEIYPVKA